MDPNLLNDFEDYWAVLPVKDSEIYFEISNYLQSPGGETSAVRVLKKSTIAYLVQNVIDFPYPVLQILKCFPPSIYGQIVYEALYRFVRDVDLIKKSKNGKLLSLLSNIHLSEKWIEKFESNVLPLIQAATDHANYDEIPLALLSNPVPRLLRSYMDFEVHRLCAGQNMFQQKAAFFMAYHRKTHFLESVLAKEARDGIPVTVQDCFYLLNALQSVNNGFSNAKETFQIVSNNFKIQINRDNLLDQQQIFYDELNRLITFTEFLHTNSAAISRAILPLSSTTSKYSVIDFLFKHVDAGCFLAKLDFENVRDLFIENDRLNRAISPTIANTTVEIPELDLYQQYYVIKILAENLLLNQNIKNYPELIASNCVQIREIIDDISNPLAYIQVIENLYTMLFYRWEHTSGYVGPRTDGSSSLTAMQESDTSEDYTDDSVFLAPKKLHQIHGNSEKTGFICSVIVLEAVLDMLSDSAAGRKESPEFILDGVLAKRFDEIYIEIIDSKWRLTLFELDQVPNENIQLSTDLKSLLTSIHGEMFERSSNSSSENEDDDHVQNKPGSAGVRRRPRRRAPFRRSEDRNHSFVNSTENDKKLMELTGGNRSAGFSEKRSIISRMLGPPINLVAICMCRGNMVGAKKIIEDNNLEDTDLAAEWKFLEHFNQTKSQLNENCKSAAENASKNLTSASPSVEHIKQIAAHGFEASQISNLVESFISNNKISQTADTLKILDKFSAHYPFLELYKNEALQGTTVTDYVLSLTSNYDICFNIFNMLPKLWTKKTSMDKLDNQMGYFGCLKHILSCVNLYNNQMKQNHGVQHLIASECYSFNPTKLATKLKQEETFVHLEQLGTDAFKTVDVLKANVKHFDVFKKDGNLLNYIYCYIMNMNRLLHFKNMTLATPEQILSTDLFSLIGDIIFDTDSTISPTDIESVVSNLNTNILHVLTKNTCPDIEISKRFIDEPRMLLEQLLANVSNGNGAAFEKIVEAKVFQLERRDVLQYVAKRNKLVAFIMGHIHGLSDDEETNFEYCNPDFLRNLLAMNEAKVKMELYGNNLTVAALNLDYFDVINLQRIFKEEKYDIALQIIQSTKEIDYNQHKTNLNKLTDILVRKILQNQNLQQSPPKYQLIEHITDINLRAEIVLLHITKIKWHQLATRLIRSILLHSKIGMVSANHRKELEIHLRNIEIYADVAHILSSNYENYHWIAMMERSKQAPETILHVLIDRNEYDLCVRWTHIHPLHPHQVVNPKFVECLTRALVTEKTKNTDLFALIESFPSEIAKTLDSVMLLKLKNRELLEYLVNYLIKQSGNENNNYQRYKIGLRMLEVVPAAEVDSLWVLISKPLLIIEQYVMNARFETLTNIMKAIRTLIKGQHQVCTQCAERKEYWPIKSNSDPSFNTRLYCDNSTEFSLLNNDINHENHSITITCIDSLLRIYAAKSLDFRITDASLPCHEVLSQSDMYSLDSLCGTFLMPREVPERCQWVRDQDATYCQCCKRNRFTMLTRRHHCRRCGRVICHTCSTKRMQIPNMYADVPVRVCIDCFRQTEMQNNTAETTVTRDSPIQMTSFPEIITRTADEDGWVFRFNGNSKHDNLLREEFCYEYAPSVSLCLSILALHSMGSECGEFLLFHCRKFEALLQPLTPGHVNSEVDYGLVTQILHCLSLAAKVRGGSPECVRIREYADIIKSVVNSGCESLIPMELSNTASLRKLRDSLVVAEKWSLAIEISLKCGFPKTGVMAAWGLACLKAGSFDTAREKFAYCLTITGTDDDIDILTRLLSTDENAKMKKRPERITNIMRSSKNQPVLHEIIGLLQTTCHSINADLIQKATLIKHSNRAIASIKPRKKENIPMYEPAINVLCTLSNLRQTAQGKYAAKAMEATPVTTQMLQNPRIEPLDMDRFHTNTRFYTECVYYLVNYGRHLDILGFLIRQNHIHKTLHYVIIMQIPPEQFLPNVVMPCVKTGKLEALILAMIDIDDTLVIWKNYIIQLCHALEKRNHWNSLYQVQLLLKDTVRASMTCVRFYTMKCSTYQDLRANASHLVNAQKHLKSELELSQWEEIRIQSKRPDENVSLAMKMDSKSLNQHINTICRQMDAAKFLGKCEDCERETVTLLPKISILQCHRIPTLFGNSQDKVLLTSLILICGSNIEEGFGLAYRIIQDLSLAADKIYSITTKYLSMNGRLHDVEKLVDCIKSNSTRQDTAMCDGLLELAIQTALGIHGTQKIKSTIDSLIRLIDDVSMQIECHIIAGQLKAAYLLAVAHRRPHDIKRIARLAEKSNQLHIKKLCEKKLGNVEGDD